MRKRPLIISLWLCLLAAIIGTLFWYNEWRYSLPTPVPNDYKLVSNGTAIALPASLGLGANRPVFLHFFNPDCPCSRFNMPHFRSLVAQYGDQVNFAVVLMTRKAYTSDEIAKRFGLKVPVIADTSLAAICGVYSTPQAVLMDDAHALYYRGNYNKTRYCTDKNTNYAQIALEGLLEHRKEPSFGRAALTAYGCQLPTCTNK